MKSHAVKDQSILDRVRPLVDQDSREIQPYGRIAKLPIALAESVCETSVDNLNQLLADTITLRDMYKKHHWQVSGPTFYQLHLLFDKHFNEQAQLVDAIAERIQTLGGVSIAMRSEEHTSELSHDQISYAVFWLKKKKKKKNKKKKQ